MYVKIIIFILFLLFGFAMIAGMVHAFAFLQEKIGNGNVPIIKFIRENSWTIIYAVWAFLLVGLLIALPAMIKDGFFADESTTQDPNLQTSMTNSPQPAGALPPLEYQIKYSPLIVVAKTEKRNGIFLYNILEVWKTPSESPIQSNQITMIDTKMWEMLGYVPEENQQVVFFFTEEGLKTLRPLEALTVKDGKILYGKDDPTIKQELTLEELRNKVLK